MSKDSDRAQIEYNLEDMIEDDQRVFRANLIAQEKEEEQQMPCDMGDNNCSNEEKINGLGNLLSNVISSIGNDESEEQLISNGYNIGFLDNPFVSDRDEIVAVSLHDHKD